MLLKLCMAAAAFMCVAAPAHARWFEATTSHFIIDADTSETKIRDFAARLERFDGALRTIYKRADDPSRRSNRVRVYAVSETMISTLCRGCPRGTAGFYNAHAGGSLIFTSALAGGGNIASAKNMMLDPQEVLFHEYSHHFMYSNYPNVPFPLWFSEGFAEFNGNTVTMPNGDAYVGAAANYRAWGLQLGPTLKVSTLLAPTAKDLSDGARHEVLYGRGWLLMHFLMLNPERKSQANDYLQRIMKGEESLSAGKAAFGDLAALDKALDKYKDGKLNAPAFVPAATLPRIDIRPLSEGAAAMMPVHLRSSAGVDDKLAARLVPSAEAAGTAYGGDPRVQTQLAEAEFDAKRLDQADSACDRALAVEPQNVTALLYKGRIAARRLADAKSTDAAAWQAVRRIFVRANRADTEAAEPLIQYYVSFRTQGIAPPKLAVDGLRKAAYVAGEDKAVRWLLARQSLIDGDMEDARLQLLPIAYSPHDEGEAEHARKALALMDAGKVDEAKAMFERPPEKATDPAA
jgi:tetratricopeptide (TPR) repeat protein